MQAKARVIYQSCPPLARRRPRPDEWEVTVLGHLRRVKDPFRTALAARLLPAESQIRVVQLGAALTSAIARRAAQEATDNPRYRWLGDLPRPAALRRLAHSRLTVVTSRLEGGPNAISEALAAGVPVIASRISGAVGMLGEDYPGYFPVGDTQALADLLALAERDRSFYRRLEAACRKKRFLVSPAREVAAWKALLAEL
jgi:glycosyltransferase involved in cell wall biosynthesis